MSPRPRPSRAWQAGSLWLVLLVSWLLGPSLAQANEGKPVYKDPRLLPVGSDAQGIPEITIRREHLSFDFSPLVDRQSPTVTALYELDNEGEHLSVPLVFASFLIRDGVVRFDGQDVSTRALKSDELPTAWETPEGTVPSVTAHEPDASGLAFTLEIPPGAHKLKVRYHVDGDMTTWDPAGWVVRYSLAPARSWKALESLELAVTCPPEWTCRVFAGLHPNPRDARADAVMRLPVEDGVLRGSWQGLPDDAITIALLAPVPWWVLMLGVVVRGVAGLLLLGIIFGAAWWMSTARSAGARFLRWIPLALVIMFMSCGFGIVIDGFDSWSKPKTSGYSVLESMLMTGFIGMLAVVVLLPVVSAVLRHRRSS